MLWGRAAGRCSFPGCRLDLVLDATETDDPSLVGEFCHIVAESNDGPRGKSPLTLHQRNSYENIVVMCNVHHKQIDDQANAFTVDRLHEIKAEHEAAVRQLLEGDAVKLQRSQELMAGYVDEWVKRCGVDEWNAWTSWLLGGDPSIDGDRFQVLSDIAPWLLARIWPKEGFEELRRAFENFRHVARGLLSVFDRHSEHSGEGTEYDRYHFKKFYKIPYYDAALYSSLSREYECQVALISDYVYELTRAANLICDCVRDELLPSFRLKEGAILVTRGMDMNFMTYTYRTEYMAKDFPELYQGERDFNRRRLKRDVFEGTEAEATFIEKLGDERRPPWEKE